MSTFTFYDWQTEDANGRCNCRPWGQGRGYRFVTATGQVIWENDEYVKCLDCGTIYPVPPREVWSSRLPYPTATVEPPAPTAPAHGSLDWLIQKLTEIREAEGGDIEVVVGPHQHAGPVSASPAPSVIKGFVSEYGYTLPVELYDAADKPTTNYVFM